jgi:hypothetical protein
MKKRDKKLAVSRETVRDLTPAAVDAAQLQEVLGGMSCTGGGTTHCSNLC